VALQIKRYSNAVMHAALAADMDVNHQSSRGETLLMRAASRGVPAVTALLLERGADPTLKNSRGKTAKDIAVKEARRHVTEKVLTNKYFQADYRKTVALLGD
jgi:ankyrin repeat protein